MTRFRPYTQFLHSVLTLSFILSSYTQSLHSVFTLTPCTQSLHSVPTLSPYTQYLFPYCGYVCFFLLDSNPTLSPTLTCLHSVLGGGSLLYVTDVKNSPVISSIKGVRDRKQIWAHNLIFFTLIIRFFWMSSGSGTSIPLFAKKKGAGW